MGRAIFDHCGVFAIPQIVISMLTLGLWLAYLCAHLRREPALAARPWRLTLEPLGALAMEIGLLGSVVQGGKMRGGLPRDSPEAGYLRFGGELRGGL